MQTMQSTIAELQELWGIMFGETPAPSEQQFAIWITRYGNETVREGLAQAAIEYQRLNGDMSAEHIAKFTSAVMSRIQGGKRGFFCSQPPNQGERRYA